MRHSEPRYETCPGCGLARIRGGPCWNCQQNEKQKEQNRIQNEINNANRERNNQYGSFRN